MNFIPLKIIPDVSMYQDDNLTVRQIDFVLMRQSVEGVIIRAGQNSWTDPDFVNNWRRAKEAGLKRGAYWFYDSRVDPLAQARHFYDLVKNDLPEWGMWCDFEESYGGTYRGEVNYKKFISEVERLFSGVVGVYTANWWWSGAGMVDNVFWQRFPLWVAQYVTSPASVTLPKPWVNIGAVLWQYTSNGDGLRYGVESLNIDLNYTSEEFYAMFGGSVPPGETMNLYKVVASGLNLRPAPGTNNTPIKAVVKDTLIWGEVDPATLWIKGTHYKQPNEQYATALDFYCGNQPYTVPVTPYVDPPLPAVGKEYTIKLTFDNADNLTGVNVDGVNWVKP